MDGLLRSRALHGKLAGLPGESCGRKREKSSSSRASPGNVQEKGGSRTGRRAVDGDVAVNFDASKMGPARDGDRVDAGGGTERLRSLIPDDHMGFAVALLSAKTFPALSLAQAPQRSIGYPTVNSSFTRDPAGNVTLTSPPLRSARSGVGCTTVGFSKVL